MNTRKVTLTTLLTMVLLAAACGGDVTTETTASEIVVERPTVNTEPPPPIPSQEEAEPVPSGPESATTEPVPSGPESATTEPDTPPAATVECPEGTIPIEGGGCLLVGEEAPDTDGTGAADRTTSEPESDPPPVVDDVTTETTASEIVVERPTVNTEPPPPIPSQEEAEPVPSGPESATTEPDTPPAATVECPEGTIPIEGGGCLLVGEEAPDTDGTGAADRTTSEPESDPPPVVGVASSLERCASAGSPGSGVLVVLAGTSAGSVYQPIVGPGGSCERIMEWWEQARRAEAERIDRGEYPCQYLSPPEGYDVGWTHGPPYFVGCWPLLISHDDQGVYMYPPNSPPFVEAAWNCYKTALEGSPPGWDGYWWLTINDCHYGLLLYGHPMRRVGIDPACGAESYTRRLAELLIGEYPIDDGYYSGAELVDQLFHPRRADGARHGPNIPATMPSGDSRRRKRPARRGKHRAASRCPRCGTRRLSDRMGKHRMRRLVLRNHQKRRNKRYPLGRSRFHRSLACPPGSAMPPTGDPQPRGILPTRRRRGHAGDPILLMNAQTSLCFRIARECPRGEVFR